MSTGTIVIVIVAVIVVLALLLLLVRPMMRRRRLQQTFGPEYERAVETHDNRASAERDLLDREKRFSQLDIRPLPDEARDNYARRWAEVQAAFVDSPEDAIREADQLVVQVMRDRGYPTEGYEQQLADLSIQHAQTLDHYRNAHDTRERIGAGVSTEDLRGALVHYRAVFADLLGTDVGAAGARDGGVERRDAERRDADTEPRDSAAAAAPDGQRSDVDARTEAPADQPHPRRHTAH